MSSQSHPARLLLHAIAFLGISSIAPVMTSPIPFPYSLMEADYSLGLATFNHTVTQPISLPKLPSSQNLGSPHSGNWERRDTDPISDLLESYNAASTNGDILRGLSSQSVGSDDFTQQYASKLSDYRENVSGFHAALVKTLSDKGLANYDRMNDIETILKDFFNLNKGLFNSIDDYLPTVPVIGPIVGPIFYDIKCLLDSILDEVEDASDDTINELQPALAAVLGKTVSKTCKPGVMLAGLCI